MIGPKLRKALQVVAYVLLAGAVISGVGTVIDHLSGRAVQENPLVLFVVTIIAMASLAFQGGALLALLSIDERIQNRGS